MKLHLPNSGKILFELQAKTADVVKTIRCDQEIRTPRLILRRRADVIPMQVTCTQVRLSYVTFLPMDAGDYEAVAVGGRAAQRNLFSIRFDVVFDNPDYNSGGDQTIEGAKPLALNTQVNDTLAPSAGDVTDWFAFDAPKGYLWLHSGRKGEGQAEIKLYAKTKQGRGEELASTALGKPKLLHLTAPRGSYGLEVRAIPGQDVIPYWIKVMAFSASPTQVLSVVDIYKESDGRVTAVFSSKELADYAPNAKIDVFRQGGETPTLVGTCALGSISGPLTLCVIERPDGTLGRGRYIAKPAQEKP